LYSHGKKIAAGEIEDPTFFFRCYEPSDPEADHAAPETWRAANPALGTFLHAEDFAAAVASTDENEFRRFRLGQWTSSRSVAFAAGIWDTAAAVRDVPEGTEVVVCFVAARQRDTVAIVGCTVDEPHVFPIRNWESSERVEPIDAADELRAVWARYSVSDLLCSEADWSWVLLQLADEGLPVTKVPRSPQRLRASKPAESLGPVRAREIPIPCDPMGPPISNDKPPQLPTWPSSRYSLASLAWPCS
jgi:hypothetical protein